MNPLVVLILSVRDWRRAQWIGLACVLAAYLVPRWWELTAGQSDVLDTLYLLGAGLLSPASATQPKVIAPPAATQSGRAGVDILIALAAAVLATVFVLGLATVLGGCATKLDLKPAAGQVVRIGWDPGPPCVLETRVDGELVFHLDWPLACPATAD